MMKRLRHKKLFILCGICLLLTLSFTGYQVVDRMASAKLRGVICIDAGHGGFDPGAIGHSSDIGEDVINLAIAKELKAEFEARGYAVVMTREDDNALAHTKADDMHKRGEIIAGSKANIMISIHMNANGDTSVSGPIVYYYPGSEDGKLLAQSIQKQLNEKLQPDRDKTINSDNYFVLRAGDMPGVIVEVGFLSNDNDEYKLQQPDYQQKASEAIAEGTEEYLRQKSETPEMTATPTPST